MRRLFEDPEQSRELRDDLLRSRAAGQDYPTTHKLAQLRAALSDPARQPLGSRLADRLAWRALHPGWKLAALLALAGTAVLLTQRAAPNELQSPPSAAAPRAQVEPAAVAIPKPPLAAPEVTAAAGTASEPPSATAIKSEPSADQPERSSRREIAQLVRIRALLAQDPAAAYRLAVRGQREFPGGLLSEERQGLAIVALEKAGAREQAKRKARLFFERYPQSPMRGMIEAELGQARP